MIDRRARPALTLFAGTALVLVFVAGFVTGAIVRDSRGYSNADTSDANVRDFLAAYHLVTQQSYYRPFDRQHLIYAAIDGMLTATGDPHTMFLSPQDNRVADTQLNGSKFGGIGAMVEPYGKNVRIFAPLPGTPASLSGIKADDVVTKIDGQPVSTMTRDQAVAKIHGPRGSVVRLTIVRGGASPTTISVRRAQIPPITAYGRNFAHHIGYIQIISFGDTTSSEVAKALALVRSHGARALILDLRDDPGGYVDAAQRVVSQFVTHGVVAYEQGVDKRLHPLPVISGARTSSLPIAVIVNGGTASAAEITAAALRDDRGAVLIGGRTYGKGSMQSVYALSDGSSIRITDRLWLTPRHRSIQGVGIRPDVIVSGSGGAPRTSDDRQLLEAERYLVTHRVS